MALAFELYEEMKGDGFLANATTYKALIRGLLARETAFSGADIILKDLLARGFITSMSLSQDSHRNLKMAMEKLKALQSNKKD
jgi:leucine-rich PPR motif-containing protein